MWQPKSVGDIDVGINHIGNIWPDSSRPRALLSTSSCVCRSNKSYGSISDKLYEIATESRCDPNYTRGTCQKLTLKHIIKSWRTLHPAHCRLDMISCLISRAICGRTVVKKFLGHVESEEKEYSRNIFLRGCSYLWQQSSGPKLNIHSFHRPVRPHIFAWSPKEEREPFFLGGQPWSLINWSKLEHSDRFIDRATDGAMTARWFELQPMTHTTRLDDKILFHRWRGTHSMPRENNWKSIFVESLAFETHYRIFDNILPEINFVITELQRKRVREREREGGKNVQPACRRYAVGVRVNKIFLRYYI